MLLLGVVGWVGVGLDGHGGLNMLIPTSYGTCLVP